MGRRERRKLKRERIEYPKKHSSELDAAPWYGKILLIGIPLFFILGSISMVLRDSDIDESDLRSVQVTLSTNPEPGTGARGRHPYILFKSKAFERNFEIENTEYEACDVNGLINHVFANDKITIKVLADEADELNQHPFFNSSVSIYGLIKDGNSYINLSERNQLKKEDNQSGYVGVGFGLILLFFVLIRKPPKLLLDDALGTYCIAIIVILLAWILYKKYSG